MKKNLYRRIYLYIFVACVIGFLSVYSINKRYTIQPIIVEDTEWLEWNYFDFSKANKNLENYVNNIVSKLTDEQLTGMVLMPALEKKSDVYTFARMIKKYHFGGYMILGRGVYESEQAIINKSNDSELPLLLAVDAEPSLLKYRLPGLDFKYDTKDLDTDNKIISESIRISNYLNNKSVNINFAPIYDNGTNREVIGKRAFSQNNKIVQERAQLFADITYNNNVFPTAKHFPGHGNVKGDTHKKLSIINGELEELGNFKYAIKNDIPIIMVGHLAVENNKKWNTHGKPASLSKKIVTNLLRNNLNFKGIIITDAMNMGALSKFQHVELEALKSGADIVLMPRDIETAYFDILNEVKNNNDFKKEILKKARRIVKMRTVTRNSR